LRTTLVNEAILSLNRNGLWRTTMFTRTKQVSWKLSPSAGLLAFLYSVAALRGQSALPAGEQDKALGAIREYALKYASGLPDYACTRITQQTRELIENPGKLEFYRQHPEEAPSWTAVVEEALTVAGTRETYKVLKTRNVFPPGWTPLDDDIFGIISASEFGSVLTRIFKPETGAAFRGTRSGKLRGRPVLVFSFDVPSSQGVRVYDGVAKRDVVVGYRGLVYADAESKAVLRMEIHGYGFAPDSEFTGIDLTLDYKATRIADREFALPYRFDLEWHIRIPKTFSDLPPYGYPLRVQAEYRDYRSLPAQSAIQTGPDPHDEVRSAIMFGDIASPEKK
jgi:hypothetical protein